MQMNGNGAGNSKKSNNYSHNGYSSNETQPHGKTCLGSVLMFLLGVAVAGLGLAISLLWIYTEGKLDSKSVSSALPVIQVDVEETLLKIGKSTSMMYEEVEKMSKPYLESAIKNGKSAWNEGGKQIRVGAKYLEENYGEFFNQSWSKIREMAQNILNKIIEAWKQLLPHLKEAWEASKPYFHELGKIIIEKTLELWKCLHKLAWKLGNSLHELGRRYLKHFRRTKKSFKKNLRFKLNVICVFISIRLFIPKSR